MNDNTLHPMKMNPTMQPTMSPTMQPNIVKTQINSLSGLPQTKLMDALGQGPGMNNMTNIIAGPNPRAYWNHSPGYMRPEVPEEGPFPVQGSIGVLIAQEGFDQYAMCNPMVDSNQIPPIVGGPNCSGVFRPDLYTTKNTCGAECEMKYPESYGEKDFGFPEGMPWINKVTNSHQVHALNNLRAGMPGQGPSNDFGCYEWIPRVSSDSQTNSCFMNQEPVYDQVGPWNKLPQYKDIQKVTWN